MEWYFSYVNDLKLKRCTLNCVVVSDIRVIIFVRREGVRDLWVRFLVMGSAILVTPRRRRMMMKKKKMIIMVMTKMKLGVTW